MKTINFPPEEPPELGSKFKDRLIGRILRDPFLSLIRPFRSPYVGSFCQASLELPADLGFEGFERSEQLSWMLQEPKHRPVSNDERHHMINESARWVAESMSAMLIGKPDQRHGTTVLKDLVAWAEDGPLCRRRSAVSPLSLYDQVMDLYYAMAGAEMRLREESGIFYISDPRHLRIMAHPALIQMLLDAEYRKSSLSHRVRPEDYIPVFHMPQDRIIIINRENVGFKLDRAWVEDDSVCVVKFSGLCIRKPSISIGQVMLQAIESLSIATSFPITTESTSHGEETSPHLKIDIVGYVSRG
jgi:hypothetical protein